MDPTIIDLTTQVMAILLQFLVTGEEEFVVKAGDATYDKVKTFLSTIRQNWSGDKEATDILVRFEEKPVRYKTIFEDILLEKLTEDPELASRIAQLLQELRPTLEIVQRMGEEKAIIGIEAKELRSGQVRVSQDITKAEGVTGAEYDSIGDGSEVDSLTISKENMLESSAQAVLSLEQLQFSAFYPRFVTIEKWQTMLVYTYIASALQAVRMDAAKFKDEIGSIQGEAHAQAQNLLPHEVEITIIPSCQGVVFNPRQMSFKWMEEWHQSRFRFRASQKLTGTAGNGEIIIYAGPLIIATLQMAILLDAEDHAPDLLQEGYGTEVITSPYKQIFASYSHDDTPVVLACRNTYKALGFTILIDIDSLRSGQQWNKALMKMIEEADIFQLFWSVRSAQSQYVRQEWRHALQCNKCEGYIRPVYWEKPLVQPPRELSTLHFAYIRLPKLRQYR